jgi:hypothetical protein
MAYGGIWIRLATATCLITIFLDVQFQLFASDYHLLLGMLGTGVIVWVLQTHLGRILLTIFSVLWLSSVVTPQKSLWKIEDKPTEGEHDKTLPPIVYIILDEHIGVEGIPKSVDPNGHVADWLRKHYVDQGFTVFGRAYSRYYNSLHSLSTLFNFSKNDAPDKLFIEVKYASYRLQKNALFELLKERGYKIHVLQSTYLDFVPPASKQLVEKSYTYDFFSLQGIHTSSLSSLEKIYFILGSYKHFWKRFVRYYHIVGEKLHLPKLPNDPYSRVSTLNAMLAAEKAQRMLEAVKPGHFYLIHLLLPHYPYAYNATCTVREDGTEWLFATAFNKNGKVNTSISRKDRYKQYLEQLQCTHKVVAAMLSKLEKAIPQKRAHILIHGDHGSRIVQWEPTPQNSSRLTPTDYIDAFSTFFVARTPDLQKGYERHPYALEEILATMHLGQNFLAQQDAFSPMVYLFSEEEAAMGKKMPPFAEGEPADSW